MNVDGSCLDGSTEPSTAAGLSGSEFVSINEVTLGPARLVLGWVTVCGRVNHLGL